MQKEEVDFLDLFSSFSVPSFIRVIAVAALVDNNYSVRLRRYLSDS